LQTKQVRPQRRLLGGESVVEGDRITPLESHALTSTGTDKLLIIIIIIKLTRQILDCAHRTVAKTKF